MNKLVIMKDGKENIIYLPEKIVLTLPAYGDMLLACRICPAEISGLARAERGENSYVLTDVLIPNQTCPLLRTVYSGDDERQELLKAEQEGKDRQDYYVWWHSHCDMSVMFSGTDIANIIGFLEYLLLCDKFRNTSSDVLGPWISLVINRMAEITARYDFARPPYSQWKVPVEIEKGVTKDDIRFYLDEHYSRIHEIVKQRVKIRFSKDNGPLSLPDSSEIFLWEEEK